MKRLLRGLPAALAIGCLLHAPGASAVPIVIGNAGYWLETVGSNTIGLAAAAGRAVS